MNTKLLLNRLVYDSILIRNKWKVIELRLDKFLTECGIGSRSQVKKIIVAGEISVNEKIVKDASLKINIKTDKIKYRNDELSFNEFRYYVMNKISGYVTATEDKKEKTVMELLPEWVIKKGLFPVGRLDKDTEGVLLFTNDGELAHFLTSPKKKISKVYRVVLKEKISDFAIKRLEEGVDIGGYITLPAIVEKISEVEILLTIREGKFHQVKKMLKSIENEVVYLKREYFGKLGLKNLRAGEVKEISLKDII